jgi:hypothetical protein
LHGCWTRSFGRRRERSRGALLKTAADLLHKLERDYARLQQDPDNVDAAYNFFVTAENLPEWVKDKAFKHKIQQQETLLTICNELATGAKHFTSGKQRPAVAAATRYGYVEEGYVEPGYVRDQLIVYLNPDQAAQLGHEAIDVRDLASQVPVFWQQYVSEASAQ